MTSDEESQKRLLPSDENPNTLDFYNSRSRVCHVDEQDIMVFYFDYKKTDGGDEEEIIDWSHLKALKDKGRWGIIRHPMVLNFVNERLLDCALFYTVHIVAYFSFLLLLSSHVFSRTFCKDVAVTAFLAVFFFFMLIKGGIKRQISNSTSFWFVVAYTFNLLTYAATFCYIWLPVVFKFDNYHEEVKNIILWFLPIIAIISAWVNFLYILRKSPYGIYIFMMVRILRSFGHIATIWIPTLIAFSFAFHLIMRDSGIEPWESVQNEGNNGTVVHKLFVILQAITKTSTMMIGEVDANDILGTRQWIPSILILAFEIITVILLMNLMVSLAVGDVSDLRNSAQDKLLKIKVNFVIEALQLSENLGVPIDAILLHKKRTNNVLVVDREGDYYTVMKSANDFRTQKVADPTRPPSPGLSYLSAATTTTDRTYHLSFSNPRMRMRIQKQPLVGRHQTVHLEGCQLVLNEAPDSGIPTWSGEAIVPTSMDACYRGYSKWLIGLDWKGYLEL